VDEPLKHVDLDARQIRTLAHPLRSRLVGELRLNGPATATKLAERFGTNTGATSYHLRQLAEVGLVEDDTGAGRGRERVWRAAHDVTTWERDRFADDPNATAAADWLTSAYARHIAERIEDWNRGVADESPEWRAAAQFSDYIMRLTAPELTEMTKELDELIERWRHREPAADARPVLLYLYPIPLAQEDTP
jgi:DNA-binding transcriptional ArsR family regulator